MIKKNFHEIINISFNLIIFGHDLEKHVGALFDKNLVLISPA
jgi:hypothetical protein